MIYHNISEYLQAKSLYDSKLFTIFNGKIIEGGKSYKPKDYYRLNPKPRYEFPADKNNPDKTNVPSGCKTRKK